MLLIHYPEKTGERTNSPRFTLEPFNAGFVTGGVTTPAGCPSVGCVTIRLHEFTEGFKNDRVFRMELTAGEAEEMGRGLIRAAQSVRKILAEKAAIREATGESEGED